MELSMDLVILADAFASAAHAAVGQVRKYDKQPYINHPREVRRILVEFATVVRVSDEMQAASLLHDVVEDTGVTLELVRETFGDAVAALVSDLTDVSKPEDGNRKLRKQKDLEHTAASSVEAKSIKLADLISNSRSIVQHDPDFARVYLHEKARILEVCGDADPGLLAEAHRVLEESRELLRKDR
jgi:(p)ppGpp synthase/HD superfamily hydrolase